MTSDFRSGRDASGRSAASRLRMVEMSRTFSGGREREIQAAPPRSSAVTALTPTSSAALELGLALLEVGGQALARVVGQEQLLLQLPLQGEGLGKGDLGTGLHRPLDQAHGLARAAGRDVLPR